jgi:hypothetical protein
MSSIYYAFMFSFVGMVFALLTVFALWRGEFRESYDVVIHRASDPIRYYAFIVCCSLLASFFIVGAVYFFLHPGIIPVQTVEDVDPD